MGRNSLGNGICVTVFIVLKNTASKIYQYQNKQ
jgi:hypothetical protein